MLYPYEKRKKAFSNLIDNLKNETDVNNQVDLLNRFIDSEKRVLDKINSPYMKSNFYRIAKMYLGEINRWNQIISFGAAPTASVYRCAQKLNF